MPEFEDAFCPDPECKDYGVKNLGNVRSRGKYGKAKQRTLLYCRTCGARFAATRTTAFFGLRLPEETIRQIIHHAAEGVSVRATARLVGCDKDSVNRVIVAAGEHCALVLSNLLQALKLTEAQLDELWTFVKKRKIFPRKTSTRTRGRSGSGQPSTRPRV
jgi:transposase-like protein